MTSVAQTPLVDPTGSTPSLPQADPRVPPQFPPPRRSFVTAIAVAAARRWQITLAVLIALLLAGLWAVGVGLDREGFPPVNTPISVVTGTYFVDDVARVDDEVVAPLEAAFRDVEGVVETSTEARPSSFVVVVEFEDGISSEDGTATLEALGVQVDAAAVVTYRPINAAKFVDNYDMLVSVVGPTDTTPTALQEQAEALADYLGADDEIATVEVRDLLTSSVDPETGADETRLTRYTRVALEPGSYQDAIAIGLIRSESSDLDVLTFSDHIADLLAADSMPVADGFQTEITADFATSVRQQLSSLSSNLLTGLLAVAVVSLLLIGWRVALLTASFMALVMLGALIGLWATGYTLNTITLFGLILTLGLLVDDAIVISESIESNRGDPDPAEAQVEVGVIRRAIDRVGSASLAGTLTTVVVFSPMLFVGGILGEFIRPIPATVIITLLLSFLFSVVFIPLAARLFLLRGQPTNNVITRGERALARATGRLAGYPSGNGAKGWAVGAGLATGAIAMVVAGLSIAGNLGFSIFPAGKDATGLVVAAEFPPGTVIDEAAERSSAIDDVVLQVLGDELETSQYVRGNERVVETFIDLTSIGSRSVTAPELVEQIESGVAAIDGVRVTVNQVENGPPSLEFPFAVQISVDDATVAAGQALAEEIQADLFGRQFSSGADIVTVTDSIVATDGEIVRTNGERLIEVRAKYDADQGLSGILNETEAYVEEAYPPEIVADRGLDESALDFDFGLESDNQDDFAALGVAGMIALGLMLLLITVQFRSLAQSILIFLAIPFSFFGVFFVLSATDNSLSFLAVVGFIALIGVAVNNSILLVDAANQERATGATASEAIASAVSNRFRPLVATTLTTIAGLLPLSLADPFWESLGFTLMGGLVSSTFLVLLAFPTFYLALEAVRTPVRNWGRRLRGRPTIV